LNCPHPSTDLRSAGSLDRLVLEIPNAETLRGLLGEIDLPLEFIEAQRATLRAIITTPRGVVQLSSSPATIGLRLG